MALPHTLLTPYEVDGVVTPPSVLVTVFRVLNSLRGLNKQSWATTAFFGSFLVPRPWYLQGFRRINADLGGHVGITSCTPLYLPFRAMGTSTEYGYVGRIFPGASWGKGRGIAKELERECFQLVE